jgi:hypothetical protein
VPCPPRALRARCVPLGEGMTFQVVALRFTLIGNAIRAFPGSPDLSITFRSDFQTDGAGSIPVIPSDTETPAQRGLLTPPGN